MPSILFATDLDRTLLPNGDEVYDGHSIQDLFDHLRKISAVVAYVTGRTKEMTLDASKEYGVPLPDYLIAEVGTVIYRKDADSILAKDDNWIKFIKESEPAWDWDSIVSLISKKRLPVELQEDFKQNQFKISYYLKDVEKKDEILKSLDSSLASLSVNFNLIWSTDPINGGVGLIDILPVKATKSSAIEYLRESLDVSLDDTIYCGDSGNDLLPLLSGYKSIVVKNASKHVKDVVGEKISNDLKLASKIYLAEGKNGGNGNYSAGIIEGLHHFGFIKNL